MPSYAAPIKDIQFVLNELWHIEERILQLEKFNEVNSDLIHVILDEAAKISENLLFPLNQSGDQEGCHFDHGQVYTPKGFKTAYQTYAQGGWTSLTANPEYGGQGLPHTLNFMIAEMVASSNISFSLYPELSQGVYHTIHNFAEQNLKDLYLPKLIDGSWTGVMCLTESHSGSDLGILRTKAIPDKNGSYKISGTKIFITGGEQDLSENIIHLVLARLPDAPAGVKGISLFLVPKILPDAAGNPSAANHVTCSAIEHKMGIKGSSTCVINYDNSVGYLIGNANEGLALMFSLMNRERLAIGLQGLALSEIAYQNALNYSKDRLQGRAPSGSKNPTQIADQLLAHPDIRRMLLTIKTFNEAARALIAWTAIQSDLTEAHPDAEQRQLAENLLAVMTPVIKGFFTDIGFENCNLALQIFGGHGYISEYGVEQYVRDARIAQIYEGTNGIQAQDLTGRKLVRNNGKLVLNFIAEIEKFITEHSSLDTAIKEPLTQATQRLKTTSQWILDNTENDLNLVGSVSVNYLHLFGYTSFAYMWAHMFNVAQQKIEHGVEDKSFYQAKIDSAKFYMQHILPKTTALATIITAGSKDIMTIDAGSL